MKIYAIFIKTLKEVLKEKRTLAMLFLAPVFIMTIFYYLLATDVSGSKYSVGVVNVNKSIQNRYPKEFSLITYSHLSDAKKELRKGRVQGILEYRNKTYNLFVDDTLMTTMRKIMMNTQKVLISEKMDHFSLDIGEGHPKVIDTSKLNLPKRVPQKMKTMMVAKISALMQSKMSEVQKKIKSKMKQNLSGTPMKVNQYYLGDDFSVFNLVIPYMMVILIFFLSFLVSGMAFLKERQSGTLEKLFLTPTSSYEIVLGYLCSFGIIAVIQTLITQLYTTDVLNVFNKGHFINILTINIMTAMVSLSISIFITSFAKSEFQVVQFIPLIILPQILLSGIFDVSDKPILLMLSHLLPITYACEAIKEIVIKGDNSFALLSKYVYILFGYFSLFFVLSNFSIRRR